MEVKIKIRDDVFNELKQEAGRSNIRVDDFIREIVETFARQKRAEIPTTGIVNAKKTKDKDSNGIGRVKKKNFRRKSKGLLPGEDLLKNIDPDEIVRKSLEVFGTADPIEIVEKFRNRDL